MLEPARAGRLAMQSDYDSSLPSLKEVLDACTDAVLGAEAVSIAPSEQEQAAAFVAAAVYVHKLLELNQRGSFRVAGAVNSARLSVIERLQNASTMGGRRQHDWQYLERMASAGTPFITDPGVLPIPNGAPI